MRKFILTILILCIAFEATSCKKKSEEQSDAEVQTEASESLHAEETLEIEIDADSEGVIAPD